MKKALVILMALVVIAGAAFAETFGNEATVKVEGNAKVTWGINLDEPMANGFKNEQSFKISIPLLTKQTYTHQSEGENYAVIDIKDVQYNLVADNNAFTSGDKKVDNVTAKLVFGDFYVIIEDKPGFKTNNAEIWKPILNDKYFDDGYEGKALRFEPGVDVAGGLAAGYKAEKFDIKAKFASKYTWERADVTTAATSVWGWVDDDDDETTAPVWAETVTDASTVFADRKSPYAIGFDLSVTPSDMITAAATFNYGMYDRTTMASDADEAANGIMSIGAKVTAKPVDGLEVVLALDAGNDYVTVNEDGENEDVFAMDALFSAKYKFVEAGLYYASIGTPYEGWDGDAMPVADAAVYLKLTDGDFVENLDAWFTIMADKLMSDVGILEDAADFGLTGEDPTLPFLSIGTGASYKYAMNDVNYIKPYFELYLQNMAYADGMFGMSYKSVEKGTDFVSAGKVGAEYGLFTNTTVTAQYEAGSTNKDKRYELINVPSKTVKGIFTLACKVTY